MSERNDDAQGRLAAMEARLNTAGRRVKGLAALCVLGWSVSVAAQEGWVPEDFYFFEAGNAAVASEVNHNFRRVLEEVRSAVPAGTIAAFAGQTVPDGWLICDGASVSASDYPELARALGSLWGVAPAGEVVLPDLRGQFLRGAGASTSPLVRTAPRAVGSYQEDALQNIQGELPEVATNTFRFTPLFGESERLGFTQLHRTESSDSDAMVSFDFDASRVVRTDVETRPVNAAVHYVIKY